MANRNLDHLLPWQQNLAKAITAALLAKPSQTQREIRAAIQQGMGRNHGAAFGCYPRNGSSKLGLAGPHG